MSHGPAGRLPHRSFCEKRLSGVNDFPFLSKKRDLAPSLDGVERASKGLVPLFTPVCFRLRRKCSRL
jgi:hypothetical protein